MDLKGKKVTVLGMGKSGLSAVRLLLREGATPVAIDDRKTPSEMPVELKGLSVIFKGKNWNEKDFTAASLVVASPGVSPGHPGLAQAKKNRIPVIGELELAARFFDPRTLFTVTGTNGKSTTVTLLGEIFREAGKRTFTGGNLGVPASEAVISEPPGGWEAVVLELSSFQLETVEVFRPHAGALLNVTPDHGERYSSIQEYAAAKFRMFEQQTAEDFAVLNHDDPLIRDYPVSLRSRLIWFSTAEKLEAGAWVERDQLFLNLDGKKSLLCDVKKARLKGRHNLENIAAASVLAALGGISRDVIQKVVERFKGLEHRLEEVRTVKGIAFINDSKGTNVGAVLRSLDAVDPPVILIAGGREKGGGFLDLLPLIRKKVRAAVLIGEAAPRMREEWNGATGIHDAAGLDEAVGKAFSIAREGETVLLSPACSSYDMFKDYEERGRRFKDAVGRLS